MQEATTVDPTQVPNTKTAPVGRKEKIKAAAAEKLTQGKEKAKQLHVTSEDYIREHPTKCVLAALGAGIALGLIIRR